jgi:hypothetical protein
MKKSTIFMAAILAAATILAAGIAVLPSPVQDAQANPCAQDNDLNPSGSNQVNEVEDETHCAISGFNDFNEP